MMASKRKALLKQRFFRNAQWYSFLLPSIICLILFTYVPLAQCIRYSLYRVNIIGFGEEFIGFKNYIALLSGAGFPRALGNTLVLAVYSLITIPVGFILATMLYSLGRGRTQAFFRVLYYMPNIITGVSVVLLFRYILLKDGGLLNRAISMIAGQEVAIGWLTDSSLTKIGVTIMSLWSGMGYAMLINLSGLQSISTEIYESASIDGCNSWKRWIHITIPNMTGTFAFLLITSVIGSFSRFTDLFILGGNSAAGKPGYSLQTILMYIYQYSFESPNYGLSSAGAMILFAMVLVITAINMKITKLGNRE